MKNIAFYSLMVSCAFLFGCVKSKSKTPVTAADPTATLVFSTGQAASVVIGEPDFTTSSGGLSEVLMTSPTAVSVSASGALYVSENTDSRVLVYNSLPTAGAVAADKVIGQTIFTFPGTGAAADQLQNPQGVSAVGSQLFTADFANHRVLIYNSLVTGASAAFAIGQSSTNTGTDPAGGVSSTTLRFPYDVFVAGTKMVIADGGYNRVVLHNSIPTSNGAAASVVLGQPDKNSSAAGFNTMKTPVAVWTDGTKIAVAELNNHRVLLWNSWPTLDGTAPAIVLGQNDLSTGTYNLGGISASSLFNPNGVFFDGTALYLSDGSNNRILVWNTWPTTNKASADLVLGQADFVTATAGASATTLNRPGRLFVSGGNLIVSDSDNNRVLIFKKQ